MKTSLFIFGYLSFFSSNISSHSFISSKRISGLYLVLINSDNKSEKDDSQFHFLRHSTISSLSCASQSCFI